MSGQERPGFSTRACVKGQDECEGPSVAVRKTPVASAPGKIPRVLTLKMSICGLF